MAQSRQALSFQEKEALRTFKKGNPEATQQVCQNWFLSMYGKKVTQSTISEILASNKPRKVRNPLRHRESTSKYPKLDPLLYAQAVKVQESGKFLTYPLLQQLAYKLWPQVYDSEPPNVSVGMMQRFAARNNLTVSPSRALSNNSNNNKSNTKINNSVGTFPTEAASCSGTPWKDIDTPCSDASTGESSIDFPQNFSSSFNPMVEHATLGEIFDSTMVANSQNLQHCNIPLEAGYWPPEFTSPIPEICLRGGYYLFKEEVDPPSITSTTSQGVQFPACFSYHNSLSAVNIDQLEPLKLNYNRSQSSPGGMIPHPTTQFIGQDPKRDFNPDMYDTENYMGSNSYPLARQGVQRD